MPNSENKEHWREHLVGLGVLKQADNKPDFFSSGNQIQATIKIRARHNFQPILAKNPTFFYRLVDFHRPEIQHQNVP